MKPRRQTAKITKRATTRPLPQGYFVPPHWRARRRQIMEGTNRIVPIGSNCHKRRANPIDGRGSRAGGLKKTRLTTATIAPTVQNESQRLNFLISHRNVTTRLWELARPPPPAPVLWFAQQWNMMGKASHLHGKLI